MDISSFASIISRGSIVASKFRESIALAPFPLASEGHSDPVSGCAGLFLGHPPRFEAGCEVPSGEGFDAVPLAPVEVTSVEGRLRDEVSPGQVDDRLVLDESGKPVHLLPVVGGSRGPGGASADAGRQEGPQALDR